MTHAKQAPTLPVIVDEAGETPGWVPALGIGTLMLIVMLLALRMAGSEQQKPSEPVDEPAEAAAAPAAAQAPIAPLVME